MKSIVLDPPNRPWMFVGMMAVLFLLDRERKAIERGSFDAVEALRLRLKHEWLASFLIALSTCAFLCFVVGRLTARYLP